MHIGGPQCHEAKPYEYAERLNSKCIFTLINDLVDDSRKQIRTWFTPPDSKHEPEYYQTDLKSELQNGLMERAFG